MGKHTTGPWWVDPKAENHVIAESRPVCSVSFHDTMDPAGSQAENAANAHLIAAAPQMREALEAADAAINPPDRGGISLENWNHRLKAATEIIRAALKAADGERERDG